MQPKSPTAIVVELVLEEVPGGPWVVGDDPDSYAILVQRASGGPCWKLHYVNKLSGGWLTGDLPNVLMDELQVILPPESHSERGFRHHEWRDQHNPPEGDCS